LSAHPNVRPLRVALVIGLATALTKAITTTIGLDSEPVAYGVVMAALVVRPDFSRWPAAIYPALVVLVAIAMGIGLVVDLGFSGAPSNFTFAVVAGVMQLLGLLLPTKLKMLSGALAVAGVLPLLSSSSTPGSWAQEVGAIALGLTMGSLVQVLFTPAPAASPPEQAAAAPLAPEPPQEPKREPPLALRLREGLSNPFFWQRTLLAMLALPIGEGLNAVAPKYLYFGVVLLFNDSVDATLARVIDRMVGVSLGILMPLLVFNTIGMGPLEIGLVMGGTTALVTALGLSSFLRTALISSGVAFVGYGALVAWYVPNRWIDYLMGSVLAAAGALVADAFRTQPASRRPAPASPSPPGRDTSSG
jgi:hypothetical protein